MATLDELQAALERADSAGDTEAARAIAKMYADQFAAQPATAPQAAPQRTSRQAMRDTIQNYDPNAPRQDYVSKGVAKSPGELASNYYDVAGAIPTGAVAMIPGLPGDIEGLGRTVLSPLGVSRENVLPNTNDIGNMISGAPRNEYEAAGRMIGSFGGPLVAKGAIIASRPIMNGISDVSQGALRAFGITQMPETEALRNATQYLSKTLARDEITTTQLRRRLAVGRDQNLTIADVGGENTVNALRTAAQSPGAARNRVTEFARNRQALQRDRIASMVEDTFGNPNTGARAAEIRAERGAAGAEDFTTALGRGVVRSKVISSLFQSPTMRSAIGFAQKIAGDEYALKRAAGRLGAADAEDWAKAVSDLPNKTAFPAQYLHFIKEGLDAHLETFRDPITKVISYSSPQVRAADRVRRAFREEVKKLNPAYAQALDKYSNKSGLLTAQRDGLAAINMKPDDIQILMSNATPDELAEFRAGFGRSIQDTIERTRDRTNAAQQLVGTELMRKRIQVVLGRNSSQFIRSLLAEDRKFETGAKLGGSQTTPRALDEADMARNAIDAIKQGATGGSTGVISSAISWMTKRYDAAIGMTEQAKRRLAEMLISEDRGVQDAAIRVLESMNTPRLPAPPAPRSPGGLSRFGAANATVQTSRGSEESN